MIFILNSNQTSPTLDEPDHSGAYDALLVRYFIMTGCKMRYLCSAVTPSYVAMPVQSSDLVQTRGSRPVHWAQRPCCQEFILVGVANKMRMLDYIAWQPTSTSFCPHLPQNSNVVNRKYSIWFSFVTIKLQRSCRRVQKVVRDSFPLGIPKSERFSECDPVSGFWNSGSLEYEIFHGVRQHHWAGLSKPDIQPNIMLFLQNRFYADSIVPQYPNPNFIFLV